MSAIRTHLPTLSLLPSLGKPTETAVPHERTISPQVLLDIAPDREALLMSGKSTEEIRQTLKIHMNENYGHWLTIIKKRQGARYRDRTARTSRFLDKAPLSAGCVDSPGGIETSSEDVQIVRRVCSAGALGSFMSGIDSRLNISVSTGGALAFDIWGDPRLSSTEKVISPRPLGPTHVLVVHESTPSPRKSPIKNKDTRRELILSDTLELPINDLVFVLNVPNLAPPSRSLSDVAARILPYRLHKELPRVLLSVPHLDTFHELVVYLHTKNQAALFRKIMPEWIRDLMHPLPIIAVPVASSLAARSEFGSFSYNASDFCVPQRRRGSLFLGMFSPSTAEYPDSTNSSRESLIPLALTSPFNTSCTSLVDTNRTIVSIANEIANVAIANYDGDDVLVRATARLDALRDNLEHLGYFGKGLWGELLTYREILLRAIAYKSSLDALASEADADADPQC